MSHSNFNLHFTDGKTKEQKALSNLSRIPNEMCHVVKPQITLQFLSMHFFPAQPSFLEAFLLSS